MTIPFLDLRVGYEELREELDQAVNRVMQSGWYVLGQEVSAFEAEYAAYCEAAHCIGVANGLEAIRLSLLALGIGPGDEVIVPSNTYIATWLAVTQTGAGLVPVEPDPATFNIDPERIEAAVTPRTRAILAVHLYGHPADVGPIMEVAGRHQLYVVEDAAQAHGARYHGRRLGGFGHATAWSFYPTKNLGAFGDAGSVTTNDGDIAERIRTLRNYGSNRKYFNEVQGFNSRLDEVQAALLRVKLRHLDDWNSRRAKVASLYLNALSASALRLPTVPDWAEPVWHLFVVRTPRRDDLRRQLGDMGVQTLIHYPVPPHLQKAYADLAIPEGSLPVSEQIHREVLSLPIGPQLPLADADRVVEAVSTIADSLD